MAKDEKQGNGCSWVIAVLGLLIGGGGIAGLIALWNLLSPPKLSVVNSLALPVMVYVNDNPAYTVRIAPNSNADIELVGNSEFPATVRWEMLRDTGSSGQPLGESLGGIFTKTVEKGRKIDLKNVWSGNYYFYPIISNNTNQSCNIVVNEGLLSQGNPGFINPYKKNIAPGYYKWTSNSNVALHCPDGIHWWGMRYGKQGGIFKPEANSGLLVIGIP